jgi:hypothetical protein
MPNNKTLNADDHVRDNKDFVFDILEQDGIASFEVEFDGAGDSGQVEGISLDKKLLQRKIEGCKVKNGTRWDPTTQTSSPVWEDDVTLQSLIEGVCYDILEENFGGWEINDGSYGTFTFDVKKRKASLTMNERVMEVNTNEYKF